MKTLYTYIILFILFLSNVYCQKDNKPSSLTKNPQTETSVNNPARKKVGLVLSGGGAKGLAHIGILLALEEYGIPVDYIAGTSMGAIIGGLYASGYSPSEIKEIFFSEELNEWLSGQIQNKYKMSVRLPDANPSLLNINFDIDKNFRAELPMSLINPIQMDFAFMDFFHSADEVCKVDFNRLMIPFFCIASDVGNKRQVIMRTGNLARSIRASMTFPFFFSPITIDNNLLCDGGIYNNFPAHEMEEFFTPDVIIGIKVAGNFDEPNEEDPVLYIENMVTTDSRYEIPCENSLLLEPDMSFVSIMDFSAKEECIKAGYDYCITNIPKIKNLVQDTVSIEQRNALRNNFNKMKKLSAVKNITVSGVSHSMEQLIERLLTMNIKKDSFFLEDIKSNYLTIASLHNIKSIEPNMYYDNFIKGYTLNLNIKTKNPITAKIGGILSTDPISNLFIGLEHTSFYKYHSYTTQVNGYFGRYYASAQLDLRLDFPNKYFPFYTKLQGNINRWNYFRNRSGLFEYSANNYMIQREANLQIQAGIATSRTNKLVIKAGIGQISDKYFDKNLIMSSDTNDVTNFNNVAVGFTGEHNSLDDITYPTKGQFLKFNFQFISGNEDFIAGNHNGQQSDNTRYHSWVQFILETKFFKQVSDLYSFGILTKSFYSTQDLFYTQRASLLNAGVFSPTTETFTRFYPEYRANQFLSVSFENILMTGSSFLGSTYLRGGLHGFIPVKSILSTENNVPYYSEFFHKMYAICQLSFIISTPMGNLALSASYTQRDNGNNPFNISLSFGSIIFNNKNIDK